MQPSVLYILHLAMSLSGSHVTTATTTTTTTWLGAATATHCAWLDPQELGYTHKLPANQLLSFGLCLSRCMSALLPSISSPLYMRADWPRSGRKKSLNISRTSCALIDICSNTHKSVPTRATKWIWNECKGEGAEAVGTVSAKCSHTSKAVRRFSPSLSKSSVRLSGHGKLVQTKRLPYANGILISQTESRLCQERRRWSHRPWPSVLLA